MFRHAPMLALALCAAVPAWAGKKHRDAIVPGCANNLSSLHPSAPSNADLWAAVEERMATHTDEELAVGLQDFLQRDPIFKDILAEARRLGVNLWLTGPRAVVLLRMAHEWMAMRELGLLPLRASAEEGHSPFFEHPEVVTTLLVTTPGDDAESSEIADIYASYFYHWLEDNIPLTVGSESPWSVTGAAAPPEEALPLFTGE